jgi:hypothetical protein
MPRWSAPTNCRYRIGEQHRELPGRRLLLLALLQREGLLRLRLACLGGPYRRLSSSTVPISVDRLPNQLQAVARLAVFPVDFADEPEITIECSLTG